MIEALGVDSLCQRCDDEQLTFQTTDELKEFTGVVGQARAVSAVQFGIGIRRKGYNLFALGPPGTGKESVVREFLHKTSALQETPCDWIYVNNFAQPQKPRAIKLPSGYGAVVRQDVERLVEELHSAIPSAFESDNYRSRKQAIEADLKQRHDRAFQKLQENAEAQRIALARTPGGIVFAPLKNGDIMSPDEFKALPEQEREHFETSIGELQKQLENIVNQVPKWEKELREKIRELNREVTALAVGHLIEELNKKFASLPADVQQAVDAQVRRADRIRERIFEEIHRGTILIDTKGEKIGQINGLSVIGLGNFSFGRPSRITARVSLGKGEVVDIEREVELGGSIHSKGVLIISGYLSARYAPERPLSLSASLVFEQSYGSVEGDSASAAEMLALLSALAEAPIKQSIAVTGSVNQHGQIQAIGGVNEKIEGFFDVCKAIGLTGEQGVLIPASNVKHLMLRQDVIDAVAHGQFHIYPMETIDQGIEIVTGVPAGERERSGYFPDGSINRRVEARLLELADKRRAFGLPEKSEK